MRKRLDHFLPDDWLRTCEVALFVYSMAIEICGCLAPLQFRNLLPGDCEILTLDGTSPCLH